MCYDEETPVSVIYDFLCRVTIRRVIIVKGDRPTGTISRGTMLRWLRNWQLGSDVARPPSLPEVTDRGASTYQEHLCRVAAGLDRQIAMLRDEVASGAADVRSVMAARVTAIQELSLNLLAFSQGLPEAKAPPRPVEVWRYGLCRR